MSVREKLLLKILSGTSDSNGIEEIINIQPSGTKCKNYQVKQIRALLIKYKLATEVDRG